MNNSARLLLNKSERKKLLYMITICMYCSIIFPRQSLIIMFLLSNIFFLGNFLCKLLLFIIGAIIKINCEKKAELFESNNLPIYTILLPLYREENIVKNLIKGLDKINYPKSKLDIKLIVESDDDLTINALQKLDLESHYELIFVPFSIPRTKAKACNYALPKILGKYVTIYDAEDIPDPNQLKKVLYKFSEASDEIICVQAKLNYYNKNENLLTKLFSFEYLIWFEFILPALEFLEIPIPLGGSSNHFITSKLLELNGWDPYNVTEDADLGIRIAKQNYKTILVDSTTMEESPLTIEAWLKQRGRWIKGYMQTYIVHMKDPLNMYKLTGFVGFFGIQFFLGVSTISFILTPFAILSWFIFMSCDSESFYIPFNILCLWKINLWVNLINILKFKIAAILCDFNHRLYEILLLPFYFLLISIASFRSIYQLFFRPYQWDKTTHGVSKYNKIK